MHAAYSTEVIIATRQYRRSELLHARGAAAVDSGDSRSGGLGERPTRGGGASEQVVPVPEDHYRVSPALRTRAGVIARVF